MTVSLAAATVLFASGARVTASAELSTRALNEREDLRPEAGKARSREAELARPEAVSKGEETRRAEPREELPRAGGREDYAARAERSATRSQGRIQALKARMAAMLHALERLQGGLEEGSGREVLFIATGAGEDLVSVNGTDVAAIDTGAGNDAIAVSADHVASVEAGKGHDAVAIQAGEVGRVAGGAGSDAIAIDAGIIGEVRGGGGNDAIAAAASVIGVLGGGAGEDSITALAHRIGSVRGGAGNDTIRVTALEAGFSGAGIRGGEGDDLIELDVKEARIGFARGDGSDTVVLQEGNDLLIDLGPDLVDDVSDISVSEGEDGSLLLQFEGGESMRLVNPDLARSISLKLGEQTIALDELLTPPEPPVTEGAVEPPLGDAEDTSSAEVIATTGPLAESEPTVVDADGPDTPSALAETIGEVLFTELLETPSAIPPGGAETIEPLDLRI